VSGNSYLEEDQILSFIIFHLEANVPPEGLQLIESPSQEMLQGKASTLIK
jgi:hypothetical protein